MASLNPFNDKNALSAASIRDKYEDSVRYLREQCWEYLTNQCFLFGEQWIWRNKMTQTIESLPREDASRTRITANKLWPASRHIVSKLMSKELVFEVPPMDTDAATVRGAYTAQSILEDLHREHRWENLREDAAWATWLGGTAVLAVDWDAEAGTPIGQVPTTGKRFGTGDIKESILTVQEIAWEPGTRDAETGTWWIRAQALPPKDVQTMYDLKDCPAADASALSTPNGRAVNSLGNKGELRPNLTLVLTYYERPNPKRPEGAVCTVVGKDIVQKTAWPFPFKDRLNMVVLRETKIPGQAHGFTVFSAAVPLQAAYNAAWSNLVEHLKLAGNARLLMPEASVDLIDELTDLPSEVIPFNIAAGKPEWLAAAGLPQWVIEQPALLAQQIDDVLGLHEVSRGVAPKNIESGLGISVLVEQDSTPLGHLVQEVGRAFEKFGTLCLKIYEAKVKETRKAKVQVPGQVPEVVAWTGKALAGQTNAIVPVDQIMPNSRAAMFAMAKDMATLFPEQFQTNMAEFARLAQLPDQHTMLENLDPDVAKAQRENHLIMTSGQVCVPADFDNHATHITWHNRERKMARYEGADAGIREIIDLHIQAHEVMAAEEMGKQIAKMTQGGPIAGPAAAAAPTANEAAPLPQPGMPGPNGTQQLPGGPGGAPPPLVPNQASLPGMNQEPEGQMPPGQI